MVAAFFVGSTVLSLVGLAYVCCDDLPPITGTVALVLTLAALAAAILH
ncbi:hypothetical protein G3I43_07145 [Streptomyces anulatus]|uniref:Uncharacterized protein n=1 Tax=Streptomyces anulatus TaxID=1892 RepID=A0A6G3SLW8_STRAQ|nr:hypothetical protein [Streptomyces anulatus]NEB83954.1 hypothetical protein [Streptomyces anulatus]